MLKGIWARHVRQQRARFGLEKIESPASAQSPTRQCGGYPGVTTMPARHQHPGWTTRHMSNSHSTSLLATRRRAGWADRTRSLLPTEMSTRLIVWYGTKDLAISPAHEPQSDTPKPLNDPSISRLHRKLYRKDPTPLTRSRSWLLTLQRKVLCTLPLTISHWSSDHGLCFWLSCPVAS